MKKIALLLAVACGSGALVFGDMSTSVNLSGSLAGTDGFILNNTDQKDADLVQFNYDGKNAGASFRFWTPAKSDSVVKLRSLALYFKPTNTLKVALGGVGAYTYTEQLDWWQVPTAASLAQFNGWDTRWSATTAFDGDNAGIMVESTDIKGLTLSAGLAPGYATKLYAEDEKAWDKANLKYGATAKYEIKGFGSVAAAYRDDGKDNQKIARVGFDTNAIKSLYTFVDLIARIDNTSLSGDSSTDAQGLAGVTVDTYANYNAGGLGFQIHLPVTLRLTGGEGDVNYLCYDTKLSYALPALKLTPYFRIQQDGISFADPQMLPQINVGTDIGGWAGGSVSVSVQYNVGADKNTWSIPFYTRVSF